MNPFLRFQTQQEEKLKAKERNIHPLLVGPQTVKGICEFYGLSDAIIRYTLDKSKSVTKLTDSVTRGVSYVLTAEMLDELKGLQKNKSHQEKSVKYTFSSINKKYAHIDRSAWFGLIRIHTDWFEKNWGNSGATYCLKPQFEEKMLEVMRESPQLYREAPRDALFGK